MRVARNPRAVGSLGHEGTKAQDHRDPRSHDYEVTSAQDHGIMRSPIYGVTNVRVMALLGRLIVLSLSRRIMGN